MEWCEAAKRAAEAVVSVEDEAEERRCIDALCQLKSIPISSHLLVTTQVLDDFIFDGFNFS